MSWRQVMFAVPSPGGVGSAELGKAARIAAALDAELELFHCVYDRSVTRSGRLGTRGARRDIQDFVAWRRQQLEHMAERIRAKGVRVRTSIRWDYPIHEGIVRQVLRRKPTLLIAQSARKGRTARRVLTQTDYKLIETCPCPVLFIKTGRPYAEPMIVAAVDPGSTHGKPAALDDEILHAAGTICGALSGRLVVFYARVPWEDAVRVNPELGNVPEVVSNDVHSAYGAEFRRRLLELGRRHDVPAPRVRIVEGYVAEALPRFAAEELADIVAFGAVSRSLFRRALVGHTSERVLDSLDCDVLVVKPPGFRTPVSRQSRHHIERSAAPRGRLVW